MKRVHLIISGDVQGVGFRAWVVRQADNLQLMGWVSNGDDGSVEVVAEGPTIQLTELVKRCERGPDVAWVQKTNVEWSDATREYSSFEVVY